MHRYPQFSRYLKYPSRLYIGAGVGAGEPGPVEDVGGANNMLRARRQGHTISLAQGYLIRSGGFILPFGFGTNYRISGGRQQQQLFIILTHWSSLH
jgi:hypothetical protein